MSRLGRMMRPMAGDECITFATAHPPDCGGHIDIASAAACATLAPSLITKPHGLLHLQDPRVLVHLDARQIIRRQHAVLRSPAAQLASAAAVRRSAQNAATEPGWAALVKEGRRTWRRPAMVLASSYSVRSVILRLTSSMNTSCAPTHRQPSAQCAAGTQEGAQWAVLGVRTISSNIAKGTCVTPPSASSKASVVNDFSPASRAHA